MASELSHSSSQQAFDELGDITAGGHRLSEVLDRTAELARKVLPIPVEASVTLIEADGASTPASTAPVAMELDTAQYTLGYGPCLASAEAGQQVLINDMSSEPRWPEFTAAAVERGVASSLSVPLPVQRQGIGALNIYCVGGAAVFTPDVCELAENFAAYAAVAIANTTLFMSAAELAQQMREAMLSRAAIEQAKGILMGQRRCDSEEAFNILVRLSQETQRKLRDVAISLIEHTLTG